MSAGDGTERLVACPGRPSRVVSVTSQAWLPDRVGTWRLAGDPGLGELPAVRLHDAEHGLPRFSELPVPPFDVFRPGAGIPGLRHSPFRFRLRVSGWFGGRLDVTFTLRDGRVASVDRVAGNDLLFDTTFEQLVAVHVGMASWRQAFSNGTRFVGKQAANMFGVGFVEQLPRQVIPPALAGDLVEVARALSRSPG